MDIYISSLCSFTLGKIARSETAGSYSNYTFKLCGGRGRGTTKLFSTVAEHDTSPFEDTQSLFFFFLDGSAITKLKKSQSLNPGYKSTKQLKFLG